jgi:hypothetical protein
LPGLFNEIKFMGKLIVFERYSQVPNSINNHPKISFKAIGLYSYIQSKPDGWDFSAQAIADAKGVGRLYVSTGLAELEEFGYLERVKVKNEKGHFDMDYILYAEPKIQNPLLDFPTAENPTSDNPLSDNRATIKERYTKESINKESNNIYCRNFDFQTDVEEIYKAYPSTCPTTNRSLGKTSKDKQRIERLLKKNEHTKDSLVKTISWYVSECRKTGMYAKNFSTFLNNIPEIPKAQTASYSPPTITGLI